MAMPEYTASQSIATGSTGPTATAAELNPFNEQSAAAVAGGFHAGAEEAQNFDEKTDAIWAFNQSTQLQGSWRDQVGGYTDPEQFQKDYAQSQQDVMNNAPSGRARDAFVKQTNQFGNHMVSKVIHQNVADARAKATQEAKDAQGRLDQDAYEMGLSVKAAREEKQRLLDMGKGVIPDQILQSMKLDGAVALDKAEISNNANILGSATTADKLADGTLGTNMQPAERTSLQNGYSLQGEADLATAKVKAQQSFNNQIQLMKSGQVLGTTPVQDAALARMMAYANSSLNTTTIHNADGTHQKQQYLDEEKFNGHLQTFNQQIADAKQEGVMRTAMMGMDNTQSDDYLRQIQTTHGLGSTPDKIAKSIQNEFDAQKQKDPFNFTMNSPVFAQKYNNALTLLDQAQQSKDPQMLATAKQNFQDALTNSLAIQTKAGVPQMEQAVMTKPEAAQYAAQIMQGGVQDADKAFSSMKERYGGYFNQAFRQLQSEKMPAGQRVPAYYAALEENSDNPVVHQTLISAMQAENPPTGKGVALNAQLDALPDKELPKKITQATKDAIKPYADAMRLNPAGTTYSTEMTQAVTSYAKQLYLSNPNSTPEDAAAKATQAVIYSQYDTHSINGRSILIPRTDGSGNFYGQSEVDNIKKNLNYQQHMISTGRSDIQIDTSKYYSSGIPASDAEFQKDLYTKGQWVLTPDKNNFQMVMNTSDAKIVNATGLQNSVAGSGVKYLYDKSGNPIQIPVASLNKPVPFFGVPRALSRVKDDTVDTAITAGGIAKDTAIGTAGVLGKVGGLMQKGAGVMVGGMIPPGTELK